MVGTEAAIKRTRLLRQLHAVVYLLPLSLLPSISKHQQQGKMLEEQQRNFT